GDEREREGAVHERLAELRSLRVGGVEVELVRVHRQAREPDVVRLADRPAETASVHVADLEVLVEAPPPLLRGGRRLSRRLSCSFPCRSGSSPHALRGPGRPALRGRRPHLDRCVPPPRTRPAPPLPTRSPPGWVRRSR